MITPPMGGNGPQPSRFSVTGLPGPNGGFSYPPGSYMTQFLDDLNGKMATAGALGDVSDLKSQGLGAGGLKPADLDAATDKNENKEATTSDKLLAALISKMLPDLTLDKLDKKDKKGKDKGEGLSEKEAAQVVQHLHKLNLLA